MTCDEAFDCLTNPQQPRPAALAQHLARCPRCQAMHETLSPAIRTLTGASAAAQRQDENSLETPVAALAVQTARRLSRRAGSPRRRAASVYRTQLYLCASVALALLTLGTLWKTRSAPAGSSGSMSASCLWQSRTSPGSSERSAAMITAACAACHSPLNGGP